MPAAIIVHFTGAGCRLSPAASPFLPHARHVAFQLLPPTMLAARTLRSPPSLRSRAATLSSHTTERPNVG